MSEISYMKINCPNCRKENMFRTVRSINVTKDKYLKDEVLNFDIFKYSCECGLKTKIFYPTLYHDVKKALMIQYTKNDNPKDYVDVFNKLNNNYHYRIVNDPYLLIEKILISDTKYDDKLLEIMKEFMIASTNNSEIDKLLFALDKDKKYSFVALNSNGQSIGIIPFNENLYQMIYDKFKCLVKDEYIIDQKWARDFLMEVKL